MFQSSYRLREPDKSEDKAERANVVAKYAKENRIDASHALELQSGFPLTKVNCLENTGVLKQVVQRGEKTTMSSKGLGYPKPSIRSIDHEEKRRRCEATDCSIVGLEVP